MHRPIISFVAASIPTLMAVLLALPSVAQSSTPPSLDQQAYNAVWERLERWVKNGAMAPNDAYSVHVLEVPRTASWADPTQLDGLVEMQRIASAIPEANFVLDPSRLGRSLHQVYAEFALDVLPPIRMTADEEKAYLKAAQDFGEAAEKLAKVGEDFSRAFKDEMEVIERMGRTPTERDRANFVRQWRNRFVAEYTKLQIHSRRMQELAPVGEQTMDSIRRLRGAIAGSERNSFVGYIGDSVAMQDLMNTKCDESNDENWESFNVGSVMEVERRADWSSSARGGVTWGLASFIGGARSGSNYSYSLATKTNALSIRFCAPRCIALSPDNWWDPELLRNIDRQSLKLKPGSAMEGKVVFGPNGEIPRLVRGVIVARAVAIEANFGESDLNEYKETVTRGGGVRVGPWRIGGGSSRTEFSRTFNSQTGGYGRSVNTSLPVIIALVTEETPETQ